MRRSALAVIGALTVVLVPATPALAAPSPAPAVPGQKACAATDTALSGITGMVTTGSGYAVVESGGQQIYLLNSGCRRTGSVNYPNQARSVQDLQVTADGTYWAADIGDAAGDRGSIAVWKLPKTGKKLIYRFSYPGGAHFDALAMVMNGNGTPVFVTKNTNGPASVYVPATALNGTGKAVALKKAGQVTLKRTGTSNPFGPAGSLTVTGGADSPDGTKVALRSYSDAYEWDVTGGDVAAAIVSGTPRITPLPDEAAGEAIAYSRDGASFLTLSKMDVDKNHPDTVLKYKPAQVTVVPGASPAAEANPAADTRSWWDKLSVEQLTYMVAAIGVIGLLMVAGGIIGIRRARKQQRAARNSRARPAPEQWDELPPEGVPAQSRYSAAGEYRSNGYDNNGGYDNDGYDDYRGGGYQQGGGGYQGGTYPAGGYRDDGYAAPAGYPPQRGGGGYSDQGRGWSDQDRAGGRAVPPSGRRSYPDDQDGYGRR